MRAGAGPGHRGRRDRACGATISTAWSVDTGGTSAVGAAEQQEPVSGGEPGAAGGSPGADGNADA
eukprot:7623429-Pyramimonas_sp.AAC.1